MPESPSAFPSQGRRLVVFAVRSSVGGDDPARAIAVHSLRPHASEIVLAVAPGTADDDRVLLEGLADRVVMTDDYSLTDPARLLAEVGQTDAFDEIVFTDDSWFGPLHPLGAVFERMDGLAVDGWVMGPPDPLRPTWIAVRQRVIELLVSEFNKHGAAGQGRTATDDLDRTLSARGWVIGSASLAVDGSPTGPARLPSSAFARHSPLLSIKALSAYPLLLDALGVSGRQVLRDAEREGYSANIILRRLVKTTAPRDLNADLGMLEVIDDAQRAAEHRRPTLVVAHIAPGADSSELVRRLGYVPPPFDLVVTIAQADSALVEAALADGTPSWETAEVRVVPDDADDVSALLVGCRDLLVNPRHEILLRLREGPASGASANARRQLRRSTWENLLDSPSHARAMLALFDREAGLGMVFPPSAYLAPNEVGNGWTGIREDVVRLRRLLGIRVPLGSAPLAPSDGMWAARIDALRLVADVVWSWRDYRASPRWGRLGAAQVALLTHAAGERGYHVRTVMTARNAAVSYAGLAYMVDQLASTTSGAALDRVRLLHRLGPVHGGRTLDFVRMHLRANRPVLAERSRLLARWLHAPRDTESPAANGGLR